MLVMPNDAFGGLQIFLQGNEIARAGDMSIPPA